jgi:hypothetical protein
MRRRAEEGSTHEMAETIDEISYDYEEDGRLVRREVDRHVLSKGSWATLMFLYQELDRKAETWRAPKVAIVRYKKWNGQYRKQSGFNISSEKQARQIVEAIERWYREGGPAGSGAGGDEEASEDDE